MKWMARNLNTIEKGRNLTKERGQDHNEGTDLGQGHWKELDPGIGILEMIKNPFMKHVLLLRFYDNSNILICNMLF